MDSTAAPSTSYLECPISIKWTIAEEKLTALKDSNNEKLETKWFKASNIPGVKYLLRIYPNGNKEETRGKVWIYLRVVIGNETKVKSDVKFSVESACFTMKRKNEYKKSNGWGVSIGKTTEFFDPAMKYIVDGKFALKCEGILIVQREKSAADENGINFDDGHIGHKLWKNVDKDFTIKVGGNSIQVHKSVLAAQSPVFKAMFESDENQMDMADFSFKVVESAVQLCYLGKTSNVLNFKEKMKLINFCNKYDIQDLKARCEVSLIKDVSISNVCQLSNYSILSNAIKLKERCAQLLIQCINSKTPVADIAILDNDFKNQLVTNALSAIVET